MQTSAFEIYYYEKEDAMIGVFCRGSFEYQKRMANVSEVGPDEAAEDLVLAIAARIRIDASKVDMGSVRIISS